MKNKKILFIAVLALLIFSLMPNIALGQTDNIPFMFEQVKRVMLLIGGSIIIIGWVIAGILYLTSAGSPEKTGIAKKALIAAITGTILIALAEVAYQIIVNLLWGT